MTKHGKCKRPPGKVLKVWVTVDRGPDAIGPAVADRYELGFVIYSGLLTATNHLPITLYGYHLSQPFCSYAPVPYTRCYWHVCDLPGLLLCTVQYYCLLSRQGGHFKGHGAFSIIGSTSKPRDQSNLHDLNMASMGTGSTPAIIAQLRRLSTSHRN